MEWGGEGEGCLTLIRIVRALDMTSSAMPETIMAVRHTAPHREQIARSRLRRSSGEGERGREGERIEVGEMCHLVRVSGDCNVCRGGAASRWGNGGDDWAIFAVELLCFDAGDSGGLGSQSGIIKQAVEGERRGRMRRNVHRAPTCAARPLCCSASTRDPTFSFGTSGRLHTLTAHPPPTLPRATFPRTDNRA